MNRCLISLFMTQTDNWPECLCYVWQHHKYACSIKLLWNKLDMFDLARVLSLDQSELEASYWKHFTCRDSMTDKWNECFDTFIFTEHILDKFKETITYNWLQSWYKCTEQFFMLEFCVMYVMRMVWHKEHMTDWHM